MTDEPLPKHPLRLRAEQAVAAYRAHGSPEHLELLRQDGHGQLAHALTMERVMPPGKDRAPYTAQVEAWLNH